MAFRVPRSCTGCNELRVWRGPGTHCDDCYLAKYDEHLKTEIAEAQVPVALVLHSVEYWVMLKDQDAISPWQARVWQRYFEAQGGVLHSVTATGTTPVDYRTFASGRDLYATTEWPRPRLEVLRVQR